MHAGHTLVALRCATSRKFFGSVLSCLELVFTLKALEAATITVKGGHKKAL